MSNKVPVFAKENNIRSYWYVNPQIKGRRIVLCMKKEAKVVAYESL
jgi:hypothetical protein